MATKKKDNSLLLFLIGATGLVAYFAWPKPAAAAPAPTPASKTPGAPTVSLVSSGTVAAPLGAPPNAIAFPTFAVPATASKGGAQLYLEAYGSSGPVFTPAGQVEPSIADISANRLSDASDFTKLMADKAFDPYYAAPWLDEILASGGNVLVWTASADSGKIIKWWLTKWKKASA